MVFALRRRASEPDQRLFSPLFLSLLAEFMGTAIFLFTITTSLGDLEMPVPCSWASPHPLHVSLAFGSSVALMSYCTLPLSGGHLNPVVTISMVVAVKVRPAWAMCYIMAQLLGATTASALLYGLTPEHARQEMGVNKLAPGVTLLQALTIEAIVSFQLVLCILATSRSKSDSSKGGPVVIGLSVVLGHLVAPHRPSWQLFPLITLKNCSFITVFKTTQSIPLKETTLLSQWSLLRNQCPRLPCWRVNSVADLKQNASELGKTACYQLLPQLLPLHRTHGPLSIQPPGC
uniref:Aquaporin 14 n=1 Tax=Pelusios castaneus TaxID=367368 RepID=A0A8C8RRB3_9SAUR